MLMILLLIVAFIEMLGVASIMPFMAVLMNTEMIESNKILNISFKLLSEFGVESHQQFLFSLGIVVFVLLFVSLFFKALSTYAQMRFTYMREFALCRRLVEIYLCQPYDWFLSRNSADIGKTILSEVDRVISNGLNTMINLIAHSFVAISIFGLLILVDAKLAFIVCLTLGTTFFLIYKLNRSYLKKFGEERVEANKWRFAAISEAFGAIKEIKMSGLERTYIEKFSFPAKNYGVSQLSAQILIQLPRFALEAIAFAGTLLLILFMMSKTGSFNDALPILSLYVFAGYRLMPALQQMYVSFSQITYIGPSLDKIYEDIKNLEISSSYPISLPFFLILDPDVGEDPDVLTKYSLPASNVAEPVMTSFSLSLPPPLVDLFN